MLRTTHIRRIKVDAPRNSTHPAPKTEHARNQVGANAANAAAPRGSQNLGRARKGAGRKPRGRPSMPHVTRPRVDPRYPVQVTIRATPGLPSLRSPRVFAALRRAITRASFDRFRVIHFSSSRTTGTSSSKGRGPPGPRRRPRARHPPGPRRQPRPRPQGAGRRRPLSRQTAHDAATDANEHDLCAAQLPQAPACPRVHRSAKLGAPFFGVALHGRRDDVAPATAPPGRGWRVPVGGWPAGPCGSTNTPRVLRPARLEYADVAAGGRGEGAGALNRAGARADAPTTCAKAAKCVRLIRIASACDADGRR